MTSLLLGLAGLGLAVRLVMAFALPGNGDIDNMRRVADWLAHTPLHIYRRENFGQPLFARANLLANPWPYPPGYFPVLLAARALHDTIGASFAALVRIPAIVANLGLAWLVDIELRRLKKTANERLLGVGGILFGPIFLVESGWHAQLDLVAVTLVVAGFVAWNHLEGDRRPIVAGVLLGMAGVIKTVPAIALLALIPQTHTRRELALLVGSAAALAAVVAGPWLLSEGGAMTAKFFYHGLPGLGGLSIVVQPALAEIWLSGQAHGLSGPELHLQHVTEWMTLGATGLATLLLLRARPRPAVGAVLLYLAVYVSAANLAPYYLMWIIPFLLLAGWVRAATAMQAALSVPAVLLFLPAMGLILSHPAGWPISVARFVFVPWADALWLIGAAALAGLGFQTLRRRRPGVAV